MTELSRYWVSRGIRAVALTRAALRIRSESPELSASDAEAMARDELGFEPSPTPRLRRDIDGPITPGDTP